VKIPAILFNTEHIRDGIMWMRFVVWSLTKCTDLSSLQKKQSTGFVYYVYMLKILLKP
jgi:hypothetical protein